MADCSKNGQNPEFKSQQGRGRPKGSVNRDIIDMREMIKQSLELAGGVDYLVRQAEANPGPYMQLVGKVIPKEVNANITGGVTFVMSKEDIDI
jgi:hypothetical protein